MGTTAVKIWSGTVSALASISPAVQLRDITVINNGTVTAYVGGTAVSTTTGMLVPAGAQLTVQGWLGTSNAATNDVFAITSSGTTSFAAGLASNAWVV